MSSLKNTVTNSRAGYLNHTAMAFIMSMLITSCANPPPKTANSTVHITPLKHSRPRVVYKNPVRANPHQRHTIQSLYDLWYIKRLQKIYGSDIKKRLRDWLWTINDYRRKPDIEKLTIANHFINRLAFIDDNKHWQQKDYWASPSETIASNGGDCEDFVIAKYTMLINMGITPDCMQLNYVRVSHYHKPHMVLTYHCHNPDKPLVLDNLSARISTLDKRPDLQIIYRFNQTGIWFRQKNGTFRKMSALSRLRQWDQVNRKIQLEQSFIR